MPLALAFGRPAHPIHVGAGLAVLALGVGGTGIAYMLFFRLLASVGTTRTLSVTLLIPAFAVFYGAVFLGEPVRPAALGALVLIVAGVAVINGLVRRPRAYAAASCASP